MDTDLKKTNNVFLYHYRADVINSINVFHVRFLRRSAVHA